MQGDQGVSGGGTVDALGAGTVTDEWLKDLVISFSRGTAAADTAVWIRDGVVTIGVRGELDMATSEQLAAAVEIQNRPPCAGSPVVLDLTGVTFIDSTGLQAVLRAYMALGSRSSIIASEVCIRLFRLAGVEARLPIRLTGSPR